MAVAFSVGSRTSEYRFEPDEIEIRPELNGRYVLPEIETLIVSIARDGQQVPVIIRKDGTKPVLVDGHRRLRAIIEINKRKLTQAPVRVRACYSDADDLEAMWIAIRSNIERVGVVPLDDAHNIKCLKKLGQTDEQIAEGYFPGCGADRDARRKALLWVAKREKLLGLSAKAQQALTDGKLKPSAAEHLAELRKEQQDKAVAEGKVSGVDIRRAAGKTVKWTAKQIREEIDWVLTEGVVGDCPVPKVVLDWLKKLIENI